MMKVVSLVHRSCFSDTDVALPDDMDIRFIEGKSEEEIIAACRGANYLLCFSAYSKITKNIIDQLSTIRLIQAEATGFNGIDLMTAAVKNIPVCNNPGVNSKTVAELTVSLMITLLRRVSYFDREMKSGNHKQVYKMNPPGTVRELSSVKTGIIGMGAIGKHVARMLKAFDGDVYYTDVIRQSEQTEKELAIKFLSFDDLLAQSDIITVHVPLFEKTFEMISHDQFAKMKQGALFLNTARGQIINQEALAQHLATGRLGGAAIDALYPEPPNDSHPLLHLPPEAADRLVLTPHLAGVTYGAYGDMLRLSLENIRRVERGEKPKNIVNGL